MAAKQRGEADGAGRGDDELGEAFALDVIEHLQDGREAELLQLVLGQLEFADGREIFDGNIVDADGVSRGDDGEVVAFGDAAGGEAADGVGDAVDVLERVGEPGAFVIAQEGREPAGEGAREAGEPGAVGRLRAESVGVGEEGADDGEEQAHLADGLDDVAGGELFDEAGEEAEGELIDEVIGDDEGAALGLGDVADFAGEELFDIGVRRRSRRTGARARRWRAWRARRFCRWRCLARRSRLFDQENSVGSSPSMKREKALPTRLELSASAKRAEMNWRRLL